MGKTSLEAFSDGSTRLRGGASVRGRDIGDEERAALQDGAESHPVADLEVLEQRAVLDLVIACPRGHAEGRDGAVLQGDSSRYLVDALDFAAERLPALHRFRWAALPAVASRDGVSRFG